MCTSLDARDNTTSLRAFGKILHFLYLPKSFAVNSWLVIFLIQALKQTNVVTLRFSHATGRTSRNYLLFCWWCWKVYVQRGVIWNNLISIQVKKSEVANLGDTPTQPSLKYPALIHGLACKGTMSIFELVRVYLCEKIYWWFVCESP